jgi:hypothetical protein
VCASGMRSPSPYTYQTPRRGNWFTAEFRVESRNRKCRPRESARAVRGKNGIVVPDWNFVCFRCGNDESMCFAELRRESRRGFDSSNKNS